MKGLLIIILFLSTMQLSAKWVDGFIETKDNNRVVGKIKLPKTEFYSGAWFICGFDLSYLYKAVKFKDVDNVKRIYRPDEIKGFSFRYKQRDYYFFSQIINYKSIVKSERERTYFLNVLYNGSLMLCRNELQLDEERYDAKIIMYEDYYLYDSSIGLTKLEVNKNFSSIKDILRKYGMPEQYLKQIKTEVTIRDVKDILNDYDNWLKNKSVHFEAVI